jgi:uncharacterized membrane-anchored protein YitT (DUF2179 family)
VKITLIKKNNWFSLVVIMFAGLLYASAFKYFVLPTKVILTGTEGIAVGTSYFFDDPMLFVILYAFFQCILITFAFFKISKGFALRSLLLVATVVSLLILLPEHAFARPEPENERMILVIFGGLLAGIAKAIAFKAKGSTADEDILGAYFAQKYRKPVGSIAIYAAIVSTVYGLSMLYLKDRQFDVVVNTLMYTSIYIFVSAQTLNSLFRKYRLSQVTIFTANPDEIKNVLNSFSDHRTYTIMTGTGGYSKTIQHIFKIIVTHEELPGLMRAIDAAENKCFLCYNDIEGLSGRYFIDPIG